jgi:hypothetical protein
MLASLDWPVSDLHGFAPRAYLAISEDVGLSQVLGCWIEATDTAEQLTKYRTTPCHDVSYLSNNCAGVQNKLLCNRDIHLFCFLGGVGTQDFLLAKQALYCLSHTSSPF